MNRLRGLGIVVALLVATLSVQLAGAHATLVLSVPPVDGVVPAAPDVVRLTFDLELEPGLSSLRVAGPNGSVIAEGGVDLDQPDRNALVADLPPDAGEGSYTVSWTVVEVDEDEEHAVDGEFSFTVDSSAPPAASATVAIAAPAGTQEPIDDASTTISDSDGDDSGIGRGALIVGGVTILVALAVVATVGRRRMSR